MNNYVVVLIGANGSGKSTPLKQLYEYSTDYEYIQDKQGRGIIATYLKDMGVILLGTYDRDCGGCDTFTSKGGLVRVSQAIEDVINDYNEVPIFLEGVLIGSYVNLKRIQELVHYKYEYDLLILHCDPKFETCLNRVHNRNGGKKINEYGLELKWKNARNYVIPKLIEEEKVDVRVWHNDDVPYDDMFNEFSNIVGEWLAISKSYSL